VQLYTIFHLNLLYSSIEEEQRYEVLHRCYWPLLRLAQDLNLPIGIEASGLTLEIAEALDPAWVQTLRHLVTEGSCEWLGSGYTQLIGPLVPAQVNATNLQLGHEVYERLLGLRPKVAFVNEQAYSAGLVQHYLNAGYQAIVMEWENPAHDHPEWDPAWQYLPQRVCGLGGESIPIIWNTSLAFQKFQRYVHGEMTIPQYVDYVSQYCSDSPRAFPLYGNDAEIFDFRPGRYETEAPFHPEGEWPRIQQVFEVLHKDPRFELIPPSHVLSLQSVTGAGHHLRLESSANPVPVKKQAKYNVLRWGVTGRDDSQLNATCWQLYEGLQGQEESRKEDWKELCYLWSSDFRTHITQKRWDTLQERLCTVSPTFPQTPILETIKPGPASSPQMSCQHWTSHREGALVTVETDTVKIQVNCSKGLAIHGFWVKHVSDCPLIGTLPHGFYQDISMGADFFSGHVVFESPVQPKVTDLSVVEPEIQSLAGDDVVKISGVIPSRFGGIRKEMIITGEGQVTVRFHIDWLDVPAGTLRLGHVTLNPSAFQFKSLQLETHNGGFRPDTFSLTELSADHGRPVSLLVSANNGFGNTEGRVVLKDSHIQVCVENSQSGGYLIPMLSVQPISPSYFCRVSFSAMEFDDTTRGVGYPSLKRTYEFKLGASVVTSQRLVLEDDPSAQREIVCS